VNVEPFNKNFDAGDLVVILPQRKFPVVLRFGPGYTFSRIENLEPGQTGIIIESQMGHGAHIWIKILTGNSDIGWIPYSMVNNIKKLKL